MSEEEYEELCARIESLAQRLDDDEALNAEDANDLNEMINARLTLR